MIPSLSLLDATACDQIHEATLDVLARAGVRFTSPGALAVLRDAGAEVDDETLVARLPRELVERTVARAPREVLLAARDPARDVVLDGARTWLTLDGTGAATLDHRTGERRPSTAADVAAATRVADALDEIGFVWPAVSANDAAPGGETLETLALLLENTGKHVQYEVQRAAEVPLVMDMLAAAADDGRWDPQRPHFSVVDTARCRRCSTKPRCSTPASCWPPCACRCASTRSAWSGATAPASLAAAVAQTNAEILSAIVLFELVEPGLPVIYVADAAVLDMRSGVHACGGPEAILMNLSLVAMGRHYGLPVMATGFTSDAKEYSVVAGFEGGAAALAAMLARPDAIVGAGLLDAAQMLYLPKLVLDAEIMRQCEAVQRGLTIDRDHLAADLICRIGPGGQYLAARETRRTLRAGEHYRPQAYGRESYDAWSAAGQTVVQRAAATVEAILAEHVPKPLPPGAGQRFAEIVATARAELA